MNEVLKRLGVKALCSVGGVILALAWWTITGSGGVEAEQRDQLPPVVFGGGGGTVIVELTLDQPGRFKADFERYDVEGFDVLEALQVDQEIASGTHRLQVEIPDDVYTYFEIGIPEAKIGSRLEWTVRIDGQTVASDSDELTEPLGRNYAFFLQFEMDGLGALGEEE